MRSVTISTHGGQGSLIHNETEERKSHVHGEFEVIRNEKLESVYDELFGEALTAYNESQKREDRKIKSYLEKIKTEEQLGKISNEESKKNGDGYVDNYRHSFYEMIITVGNFENHLSDEETKEIYVEYLRGFEERNPQLKLFGIYYHGDEKGAPHLHLDFVPFASGYSRGMSVQNSISKALKMQGIKSGRLADFWKQENEILQSIVEQHGYNVEHPLAGKNVRHKSTEAYKQEKENQELKNENSNLENKNLELKKENNDELRKNKKVKGENKFLFDKNEELREDFSELQEMISVAENHLNEIEKEVGEKKKELQELKKTLNNARERFSKSENVVLSHIKNNHPEMMEKAKNEILNGYNPSTQNTNFGSVEKDSSDVYQK